MKHYSIIFFQIFIFTTGVAQELFNIIPEFEGQNNQSRLSTYT